MGQRKNDPHQKLESLERWSAKATLLILFGILIEIGALFWTPHTLSERISFTAANALIAFGLIAEYIVILRAIVATGEANRESDEKVASANERAAQATMDAAEARERTAQIEKLTAWRRVSSDQHRQMADAIRSEMTPTLNVCIQWERGDPEAYSYAFDLHKVFIDAGVERVSGGPNSWLDGWQKFGLHVAASPAINLSLITEAVGNAGIQLAIGGMPFGFPTIASPMGLYIFVAPKLPLHFEWFANAGDANRSAANANTARESNI